MLCYFVKLQRWESGLSSCLYSRAFLSCLCVYSLYSLRPKINAILRFKICLIKNAILTNQPQKTRESISFSHKR
jgi:hypothetical protein